MGLVPRRLLLESRKLLQTLVFQSSSRSSTGPPSSARITSTRIGQGTIHSFLTTLRRLIRGTAPRAQTLTGLRDFVTLVCRWPLSWQSKFHGPETVGYRAKH